MLIRQDDLLAIAPEYRKKVKESVTGQQVSFDGNLLEEVNPAYLVELSLQKEVFNQRPKWSIFKSSPALSTRKPDPYVAFFQDFGDTQEGDGFYVARDSMSICGINAMVAERSIHCVCDSGCSIVAISDTACNALGIAFNPRLTILYKVPMVRLIG